MGGRHEQEENVMNCIHCRGEMQRSTAPFHVTRNSYHLALVGVPTWVCNQCGETYFEEREVVAIQTAIRSLDDQTRQFAEETVRQAR